MKRLEALVMGLVFLVISLLGALVAFTPIAANSVHIRDFATMAFAMFLAWSAVEIVKAVLLARPRSG